ncbi:hypothetical protein IQ250_10645, partial [Pseudanabaenaceae cyanobacterium LEGE 13415]|nr:hypothetical protein [Pseudanabaenaceae cyanobacterium LEGE 13415]
MGHSIEARLSVQSLVFRPGGEPVSFGIEVLNQSDRFVAFELSLSAAGSDPAARWYRLSPEVSAAKPPGDSTDFRVEIIDSPIPNFAGTVNLTVRIFSPQLSEERRLVLRLTIEPGSGAVPLKVDVLGNRFQVYPRNLANLTARVQNLGSRATEVLLRLTELDPAWIVGSAERRVEIGAGQSSEVMFQCQPPSAQQAPSQDYPFTIAATTRDGTSATGNGIVEVLPIGFVQFEAKPQEQKLPASGGWLPDWRSRFALFELVLKNTSNLRQQASIELRGNDCQQCEFQLDSTPTKLPLGEATPIFLKVKPKRPWIGRVKLLQFEAKAWLSDSRLGSADPATHRLLLKVFPIVPLWLLLALLAAIASLIMLLLQPPAITHLASVNAVLFSGTSGLVPLVLSGSDDCTIRSWTVQETTLQARGKLTQGNPNEACSDRKPNSSSGLLAMTGKPVRTLALIPANNQLLFAGLQ